MDSIATVTIMSSFVFMFTLPLTLCNVSLIYICIGRCWKSICRQNRKSFLGDGAVESLRLSKIGFMFTYSLDFVSRLQNMHLQMTVL